MKLGEFYEGYYSTGSMNGRRIFVFEVENEVKDEFASVWAKNYIDGDEYPDNGFLAFSFSTDFADAIKDEWWEAEIIRFFVVDRDLVFLDVKRAKE